MTNQEPEFLKKKSGAARWEWFKKQKELMRQGVEQGKIAELKPETMQALLYMMELQDLKYCEVATMHHNVVVTMASAAIEDDIDSMNEWLLNALDQADCSAWQMYESGQAFYKRNQLPWPSSPAEHQENIKAIKIIENEDDEKFAIWYEENVQGELK